MSNEEERAKIQEKLQEAQDLLEKDTAHIPERLYAALEGVCSIFLAWKQRKGAAGWSQDLVDLNQKPLFTKQQGKALEASFQKLEPDLETIFEETATKQKGGDASAFKHGVASDLLKPPMTINPKDVSIDKVYHTITDTLDSYDEQWREIANNLGIVKGLESMDYKGVFVIPFVPPIPVPYYILGKTILPFLNAILDMLRLAIGSPVYDIPSARIILSVVLAFMDLIRGEWQNAVLSLFGVISSTGVLIGFTGKLIRNAWLLVAPDLQKKLRDTTYQSTKSMLMGFILWSITTFSPDLVRVAADQFFGKLREVVVQFNEKAQAAEDQAQGAAESMGVKVTFPQIPLSAVPSFDDIQNLQTLARQPEIFCSPEFQEIMAPVLLVPPLRLILELSNIPTLDEDVKQMCVGTDKNALSDMIVDKITPSVDIIPGGLADTASSLKEMSENPEAALKSALPEIPKAPTLKNITKKTRKGGRRVVKKPKHKKTRKSRR